MADVVLSAVDGRGVATVTLNRPEVHNAYDGALVGALIETLERLAGDPRVRLLVLRGNGRHFQAGADLAWLKRMADAALEENVAFSRATTAAMRGLNEFPAPTLALVHGACYGGGVGMVACCDVRIATQSASFALSEMERLNTLALDALTREHNVKLTAFPEDVVAAARRQADDVLRELAGRNAIAGKVHASYTDFRARTAPWSRVSTEAVLRARA